jgi:hypothetical protein
MLTLKVTSQENSLRYCVPWNQFFFKSIAIDQFLSLMMIERECVRAAS